MPHLVLKKVQEEGINKLKVTPKTNLNIKHHES